VKPDQSLPVGRARSQLVRVPTWDGGRHPSSFRGHVHPEYTAAHREAERALSLVLSAVRADVPGDASEDHGGLGILGFSTELACTWHVPRRRHSARTCGSRLGTLGTPKRSHRSYRGRKRGHLPVQVSGSSNVSVRLGPFASVCDHFRGGFDSGRLHFISARFLRASWGNGGVVCWAPRDRRVSCARPTQCRRGPTRRSRRSSPRMSLRSAAARGAGADSCHR
jgi:hypothetical protein